MKKIYNAVTFPCCFCKYWDESCDQDLWGLQKKKQQKTVKFSEIRLFYDREIKVQTREVFLLLMLLFLYV